MAEKQRPKPQEQKDGEKSKLKAEKTTKLKELEAQLAKLEKETGSEQVQKQISTSEQQIENLETELASLEKEIGAKIKVIGSESTSDAEIDKELNKLENEIASETLTEVVKSAYEKLVELHPWLEQPQYGFMFTIPNSKQDKKNFDSWQEEWAQIFLDYAKNAMLHIIYPKNLLTESPFNKFQDRIQAINYFSEYLVKKKIAEWLDKKKEMLRIYWKSLEEWADLIMQWITETGKMDIVVLPEIRDSEREFVNLPEEDLKKIFKILEKQGKCKIISIDSGDIAISFKKE